MLLTLLAVFSYIVGLTSGKSLRSTTIVRRDQLTEKYDIQIDPATSLQAMRCCPQYPEQKAETHV
jgi:hypothetical protein